MMDEIVDPNAAPCQGFSANMRQVMVSEGFSAVRERGRARRGGEREATRERRAPFVPALFAAAPAVVVAVWVVVLLLVCATAALSGCAKPAPGGLAADDATRPADPTAKGEPVPKGQSAEGVPVTKRGGYWSSYYRHRDGDKAVYRVTGNVRRSRKLTVSYRFRGLKLPDGQTATVLMVRRDYRDDSPLVTFLLEDETSGTTRAVGRQDPGSEVILFYDPPPLVLDWAKVAKKGYEAEIPYQPVIIEDNEPRSAGEMTVETFEALGRESVSVRDATGTAVRYRDCLKWRVTRADGSVVTQWFGDVGEVVRQQTRLPGGKHEREDLIRLIRGSTGG